MRLIRWALWSRNRLVTALAVVLLGAFAVSTSMALLVPAPPEPTTEASTRNATAQPEVALTPRQEVRSTTVNFLTAFSNAHRSQSVTWVEDLRDYATTAYLTELYAMPTPPKLPEPKRVRVQAVTETNALVQVKYPKRTLAVSLEPTDEGWKVNAVLDDTEHNHGE